MANIKSQKKRIITNEKSRMRNRAVKAALKTSIKRVEAAVEAKNGKLAYGEALRACRDLDKACSKGVIHKNQAANRKSGVMVMVKDVVSDADRKAYKKPEKKMPKKTGSKKAAVKKARQEQIEKDFKAREANKKKTQKEQAETAKRKKTEEEAAAKAEAEEAKEEVVAEEAPAEESKEEKKED